MSLKRNLDDIVYETICFGFVSGAYVSGKRLDPSELAERYQVSKTPVIQALKRMVHEHIVEITSGGKYFIPVADKEEVESVCGARLLFEEHALVTLCDTITEDQLVILEHIEKNSRAYFEAGDYNQYFTEDMKFHKKLVEFSGNACLTDLYNVLLNRYMVIRTTTGMALVHDKIASNEHLLMIKALKDHSKKDVRRLVRNHIGKMEERLNEKVE